MLHVKPGQDRAKTVNGRTLKSVIEQRNIGVQMHGSHGSCKVDRMGKRYLAHMTQLVRILSKSRDIILQLYNMLVSPHLKHCV